MCIVNTNSTTAEKYALQRIITITMKTLSHKEPPIVPHVYFPSSLASSVSELNGKIVLVTVRNATRLAQYIATITTQTKHHVLIKTRPVTELGQYTVPEMI